MPKRANLPVTTSKLYQIDIEKSIHDNSDFFALIMALLGGYFTWREKRMMAEMANHGISQSEISRSLCVSRTTINKILSKPDSIKITDESPSQVPADQTATCAASSVSLGLNKFQNNDRKDSND